MIGKSLLVSVRDMKYKVMTPSASHRQPFQIEFTFEKIRCDSTCDCKENVLTVGRYFLLVFIDKLPTIIRRNDVYTYFSFSCETTHLRAGTLTLEPCSSTSFSFPKIMSSQCRPIEADNRVWTVTWKG